MSNLDTVIRAAHDAGFPVDQLVTAGAIAYAESGLNENATHKNSDGSTDYGLWQINSVHGFPELSNGAWKDPRVNARLAFRVYQSQGWNAWSTHKPSDPIGYARYLGEIPSAQLVVTALFGPVAGAGAAASTAGQVPGSATGAAGDALSAVPGVSTLQHLAGSFLKLFSDPNFWVRVAKFVGGFASIVVGISILTVDNPAVGKAVSVVAGGTTKVAAAKVAKGVVSK